jgi:multidrug resistance efflux pump
MNTRQPKAQLAAAEKTLTESKAKLDAGKAQLDANKAAYEAGKTQVAPPARPRPLSSRPAWKPP